MCHSLSSDTSLPILISSFSFSFSCHSNSASTLTRTRVLEVVQGTFLPERLVEYKWRKKTEDRDQKDDSDDDASDENDDNGDVYCEDHDKDEAWKHEITINR